MPVGHDAPDPGPEAAAQPRFRLSPAQRAQLLDSTLDVVAVLDTDGNLIYRNDAVTAVLGWDRETGPREAFDLVHPDDISQARKVFLEVVEGRTPIGTTRVRFRHSDGSWRWLEVVSNSRLSIGGRDCLVVSARDVTERVEVEEALAESEQRFRSIVEASGDAMLLFGPSGEIRYMSPQSADAIDRPVRTLFELAEGYIHHEDRHAVLETFDLAADGAADQRHAVTLRLRSPRGGWMWIEVVLIKQPDLGGDMVLVASARDVNARVEAERALSERLAAEDLVGRITARLVDVRVEDLEDALTASLGELGRFCAADRAWIFQLDGEAIRYTHEWCGPGIAAELGLLEGFRISDLPAFAAWISNPGQVLISSVSAMAEDMAAERAALLDQGIQSLAAQSMFVRGELFGLIGLDAVHAEHRWPDEALWALRSAADVLAAAIRRCDAEAAVLQNEARFRAMIVNATDGIRVLDSDMRTVYASPAVLEITGTSAADLDELSARMLWVHPDDRVELENARAMSLSKPGVPVACTYRLLHSDGHWVHIEEVSTNLIEDPAVGGLVVNMRDVTDRHRHEMELLAQARRDPLTDLPNRRLLDELVDAALARLDRGRSHLALMYLDLDRFKLVNDSLGHHVGDALLVEAASRLREAVRRGDVVARISGDEFVVLCEPVSDDREALEIAERVAEAFRQPFTIGPHSVYSTASIGVVVTSSHERDRPSLLRDADAAMYSAKSGGRNRVAVFSGTLVEEARERLAVEAGLRKALAAGELVLYYQPILDLAGDTLRGAEALLRWRHPDRGLLPPAAFLDVAEETGLIVPIGSWVVSEACRQLAEWHADGLGAGLDLHVNVSVRQLIEGGVAETLRSALERESVDPAQLCMEITESALLAGDAATRELEALRACGVRMALDDFGTGHSSLAYLRNLKVEVLKIGSEFVDGIVVDPHDRAIVTAIVKLAQSLGISTVGEGVEIRPQASALRNLGCDLAQGHLFARPLTAERFADFVRAHS